MSSGEERGGARFLPFPECSESVKEAIRFSLPIIIASGLSLPPSAFPSQKPLVIEGARALDGRGHFHSDCRVVIADGKIIGIGPQVPATAGAVLIDGREVFDERDYR
jgi:hypothetical protein